MDAEMLNVALFVSKCSLHAFNSGISPPAAMECFKDCCRNLTRRRLKEQETQGETASAPELLQSLKKLRRVLTFAFLLLCQWSRWRCPRLQRGHLQQDRSPTERGRDCRKITFCPSCPPTAGRCRLSCPPLRPPTCSPEAPASPICRRGLRVGSPTTGRLTITWTESSAIMC